MEIYRIFRFIEGKDDCLFLYHFLLKRDDIQIINYKGNDKLTTCINSVIRMNGFDYDSPHLLPFLEMINKM